MELSSFHRGQQPLILPPSQYQHYLQLPALSQMPIKAAHATSQLDFTTKQPLFARSQSQVPSTSLDTYLRSQDRRIEVSTGDGNCLFRSLAFQLTGKQDEHISVRTLTVRFENLNQSIFQPHLTPINHPTMAEHVKAVQKPGVFGTHLEILAIATYYGVPIYYCQKSRNHYSWHCVDPIRSTGSSFRLPDLSGSPLEQVPASLTL